MNPTWHGHTPDLPDISPAGWLRVVARGLPLAIVVFGGLLVLLLVRLLEQPIHGAHRPWTPYITQAVCRAALALLGVQRGVVGEPMRGTGAIAANHSSWLDIFVLNAGGPVVFVSKAEVAGWPGIGWLARATGTVFIERRARAARDQRSTLEERLATGETLVVFPEGTSTDGHRVLPFKTTLFAAFFGDSVPGDVAVQPATVVYTAPEGADPRFYGWWGDMDYGPHLLRVLAQSPQGRVDVIYHPPIAVAAARDRKALAGRAEDAVRHAMPEDRQSSV